jgi:hypothetical protein
MRKEIWSKGPQILNARTKQKVNISMKQDSDKECLSISYVSVFLARSVLSWSGSNDAVQRNSELYFPL